MIGIAVLGLSRCKERRTVNGGFKFVLKHFSSDLLENLSSYKVTSETGALVEADTSDYMHQLQKIRGSDPF